ncbi:hypothetical protein HON22_01935 [Candidatus Peregrinibacteria bacterium]|jgi:hypothetical protein|nr:hypothetical protein [Candidatus Peregrinibacteria bacterium]
MKNFKQIVALISFFLFSVSPLAPSDAVFSQSASIIEEIHKVASIPAISFQKKTFDNPHVHIQVPKEQERLVREILAEIPESHLSSLKKIEAEFGDDKRRGLASFRSIYLGVDAIESEQELRRVLIHEIGHVVDLGALQGKRGSEKSAYKDGSNSISVSDPSIDFYSLCWGDEHTQNTNCSDKDFVSEYAQVDVFEDFAESYLLFTENNESFKAMAEESDVIAQKYEFFASTVFNGNFESSPASQGIIAGERVWDLTKVF